MLESVLTSTYDRDNLIGKMGASKFMGLYGQQLSKGRGVIGNYDFFIKHQLITADIPCLFSMPKEFTQIIKETKGIATRFAKLQTDKEILEFAKEYGLLGVLMPSYISPDYGPTVIEPINFWKFYINQIKNLLKLYKMLKKKHKNKKIDIIGELINYKEITDLAEEKGLDPAELEKLGLGPFEWKNGGSIYFAEEPVSVDHVDYDYITGVYIFISLIRNGLKGAINPDYADIVAAKDTEIGFRIKEVSTTNYLLAAIYYDLLQLFNTDKVVKFCEREGCGNPFIKSGRKKYCCDSCKTQASNDRRKHHS
ncbi:hypothetical protein V7157_28075 [Neobacillus drentensis]|uniref:hypothetical protein n=1 Tax=Neobacillus drentensis TaxID=220684 RepID=UPI0030018B27